MLISYNKLFKIALYSNALYVLLLFLFQPNGINIEKVVISSFLLLSVIIVIVLVTEHLKALREIPRMARYIFGLLILYSIIVVARSFSASLQDWVTNFGNVYMALAWFVPCVLLLGQRISLWNMVFKAIWFMFGLMFFAFLLLPFQRDITTEWTWLLRPIGFVLLVGIYKKSVFRILIVSLVLIMYIIIAIKVQQRIEFILLFMVLLFLTADRLRQLKIRKAFFKYIIIGFTVLLLLIYNYGYENISNMLASVIEFQDSRTFLFNELFTELGKTNDLWFGRGSLGTYYSQFFEGTRRYWEFRGRVGWAGDVPERITTEVGYLQMILKGGVLLFSLTFFLMIYAAHVAIFKSKNKFCKRLGLFILILSLLSLVSFRPAFTPMFIILWLAIGTVLNKNNRNLTDLEIKNVLNI